MHYTVSSVDIHLTLYNLHFEVFDNPHFVLYNLHFEFEVYNIHFEVYNQHFEMYNLHFIVWELKKNIDVALKLFRSRQAKHKTYICFDDDYWVVMSMSKSFSYLDH